MGKVQKRSPSAEASDRGPAKYFHGREKILANFRDVLWLAQEKDGGTTFLIQGAPGASKTALLYECEKIAEKSKWEVAEISSVALWDPNELQRALESKRNFKLEGGSAGVAIPGVAHAEVTGKMLPQTVHALLQEGKDPLLLTMDEAQILGVKDEFPAGKSTPVRYVLNAIHNDKLDRPVILIAAGLGTTLEAFEKLGISRFEGDARVELGALGKEAERAVLHDWLTEDGKATGDTTAWIDAIVKETHGWPQHILSYVKPALDQLHTDKGGMTAEGLATVLEAGRARRTSYYRGRAEGFDEEHRQSFAKVLADVPLGGSITRSAVLSPLTQEYGPDEAKKLFRRAKEKGLIVGKDGLYVVPIPSMHDWLVSNYARI